LHPTDASDDYEAGTPFPAIDSVLKAAIVEVDLTKKQLVLSTRRSKMYPEEIKPVTDREIRDLRDLVAGETVRGFIKSVAEHGLFVTLGRNIDARVQIRELFDDVSLIIPSCAFGLIIHCTVCQRMERPVYSQSTCQRSHP
jgi:rRNA biogenesis protein RRP5